MLVHGRYNATPPTVGDGAWTDLQFDASGNLKTVVSGSGVNTANAQYVENGPYVTSRKTADGQVKAGAGFIHTITIAGLTATPTAGLLTIYDSLTEANTVLYSEWVFATVVGHSVLLDIPFGTGCYVGFDATLANVQVTVSYR